MLKAILNKISNKTTQKKDVAIILDAGHGKDTKGNRSPVWPDGSQLFEWEFNRDIVRRISEKLLKLNIEHFILVPEDKDIALAERVKRANDIYKKHRNKCFLVSVHVNAGKGTGWEVWTSVGTTKSDNIATIFWNEMKVEFPNKKMRLDTSDGDVDKETNYTILYATNCPAILTENFFMDTENDCRLIMSEDGRKKIADAHVRAIQKVIEILY